MLQQGQDRQRELDFADDRPQDDRAATSEAAADHVLDDLLVEEVSIDGMCGVY